LASSTLGLHHGIQAIPKQAQRVLVHDDDRYLNQADAHKSPLLRRSQMRRIRGGFRPKRLTLCYIFLANRTSNRWRHWLSVEKLLYGRAYFGTTVRLNS
jgi:hypothetical protein